MRERKIERALVTGASSMIGAALTKALLEEGVRVTAIVRPGSKKLSILPENAPGLQVIACDISELSTLPEEPQDAFFHFMWQGTIGPGRNDTLLQEENVRYTLDAVEKAKACGCSVFIGAGSQAEYGPKNEVLTEETPLSPVTAYGKAKKKAEELSRRLARTLELDHVFVRILSVYGPGDNPQTMIMQAIQSLTHQETPSFTPAEQLWDYLYAEDAAEAFKKLAKNGRSGEAYVLGSGTARPLKEYIYALRDAVDPTLPVGIGALPYAESQIMNLQADIGKLTKDTGFLPEIPFEEGIRRTICWYRENLL